MASTRSSVRLRSSSQRHSASRNFPSISQRNTPSQTRPSCVFGPNKAFPGLSSRENSRRSKSPKSQPRLTTELEVFIHGGMCVSYSGRVYDVQYNDGARRQSRRMRPQCRWNYHLFHQGNHLSSSADFQMSAKDLATLDWIPDLLQAGIASLKIEGRMKSIHYIAMVVKAYRQRIDDILLGSVRPLKTYQADLEKAENRLDLSRLFGR
ncbi:MAG: U32 family peptidase [Bacillus subtilis]|nr:U32 family peptidase [Bacillus subtilis]